jgi:hypothetical protein
MLLRDHKTKQEEKQMRFQKRILLKDITPEACANLKIGQYITLADCATITGRFIGFTPSGAVRIMWRNQGSFYKLQKTVQAYKRMCARQSKDVQMSLEF